MPTPHIIYATPWTRLADGWAIASRAYARAMHEAIDRETAVNSTGLDMLWVKHRNEV